VAPDDSTADTANDPLSPTSDGAAGSEGTGLNGRSYPQHDTLVEQLRFQDAIDALQRSSRCPDARVVTVSEDHHKGGAGFVYISLGVWQITSYADYDHDEAEVFIRVKQNFPDGKKYGFFTDPVVRVDEQFPDGKTEVNREIAQPLLDELDVDEFLVWSRDWRHLTLEKHEDLRKATGLTKRILSEPFEEDD
jgi:hypothetical protein